LLAVVALAALGLAVVAVVVAQPQVFLQQPEPMHILYLLVVVDPLAATVQKELTQQYLEPT
jgi:hypothetical protein